jgi:hypothetical protein
MQASAPERPKPRVVEAATVWQFLRIVYMLVQAYGLNRAMSRMSPEFLSSGPFGGCPYAILLDIAGMVAFVVIHGRSILGLINQEPGAPGWLLRASALAAAWNLLLAALFIKAPLFALYSVIPLCFAVWFSRQPAVRAYFRVTAPPAPWQMLKVGRYHADVVLGGLVAAAAGGGAVGASPA